MKAVTSALTIGTGGSAGSEGPIVQIASAFGSTLGQLLGVRVNESAHARRLRGGRRHLGHVQRADRGRPVRGGGDRRRLRGRAVQPDRHLVGRRDRRVALRTRQPPGLPGAGLRDHQPLRDRPIHGGGRARRAGRRRVHPLPHLRRGALRGAGHPGLLEGGTRRAARRNDRSRAAAGVRGRLRDDRRPHSPASSARGYSGRCSSRSSSPRRSRSAPAARAVCSRRRCSSER